MCEFGQYASFLELSFAVNLLFAAWNGLYGRLSTLRLEQGREGDKALAQAAVDESTWESIEHRRRRCAWFLTAIRRVGQGGGVCIALLIGTALLLVDAGRPTGAFAWWLMVVAGSWQPFMMASMFLTATFYGRRIRRRENEAIRAALTAADGQREAVLRKARATRQGGFSVRDA